MQLERLRHRRLRAARLVARPGAARPRRARHRAARDDAPRIALSPRGHRGALHRRARRRARRRADRRASLGEDEVDTVFHLAAQTIVGTAQPLAGADVRDEHPRHLGAAGGLPPRTASRASSSPPPTRPTAATTTLPYREDLALQPRLPLRRLQGRDRPHRALLLAHLRPAGGGDALREPLRRRGPQPLAADPRGRRRRAGRPRARHPLRRHARARLPLRRGRRRRLPGDRRRARRATARRGEAFNAGGGRPGQRARGRRARRAARPAPTSTPDVRGSGTPAGEIDRQ